MLKTLSASLAALAISSSVALAASGDVVTHVKLNDAHWPNAIMFTTLVDGVFNPAVGDLTGVVQCFSSQDANAQGVREMLTKSQLLGVDLTTSMPIAPVYFTAGNGQVPTGGRTGGALHPEDCPAGTYIYNVIQ